MLVTKTRVSLSIGKATGNLEYIFRERFELENGAGSQIQLPIAFPIELGHFLLVTQMNVIRNQAA
jgi:hypothetical protein